jgi:MoxR-like ATPase
VGPSQDDWLIYQGAGEPHDGIQSLPEPPPWRHFGREGRVERAQTYQIGPAEVEVVNAALRLRRPLLVTGKPGTGKSSLADSIAHELKLGSVLRWAITSRSTLNDGLYRYDAIGRLHEPGLQDGTDAGIGRYLRLGPLGTALLPRAVPRVLLIDELDKSDIDLPNDLLGVFEEGSFTIPELERLPEEQEAVDVFTADPGRDAAQVRRGLVKCDAFPVIVITSNGEREFPPPFLRRCLRLDLKQPGRDMLIEIVRAHLGPEALERSQDLIDEFLRAERGDRATDQLLNAVYLATSSEQPPEEIRRRLTEVLLRPLTATGP